MGGRGRPFAKWVRGVFRPTRSALGFVTGALVLVLVVGVAELATFSGWARTLGVAGIAASAVGLAAASIASANRQALIEDANVLRYSLGAAAREKQSIAPESVDLAHELTSRLFDVRADCEARDLKVALADYHRSRDKPRDNT